jgi:DNA repair photolyase
MANLIIKSRKSTVLRHPSLPCNKSNYTVNLLAGCPSECKYCYARSFRSSPQKGDVHFFANSYELCSDEIRRKRKKPSLVYFSTACEPFVSWPKVQDALYGIMKELLDVSIPILVSTKSVIPDRFISLFCSYPKMVYLQIGITTLDDSIRELLEPGASSVENRFKSLEYLIDHGLNIEVRMDPLIPGLTDSDIDFNILCKTISSFGVCHASASYLFLRKQTIQNMNGLNHNGWFFDDMLSQIYTNTIEKYCGGGTVRIASYDYRLKKLERFKSIAADHDIYLRLCSCKNPDITKECCHPEFPISHSKQLDLF